MEMFLIEIATQNILFSSTTSWKDHYFKWAKKLVGKCLVSGLIKILVQKKSQFSMPTEMI